MRMIALIEKKKHGETLSGDEINEMIRDYTEGKIPDEQMSAFLMAVCFTGMTDQETAFLTGAMANSGRQLNLDCLGAATADKHSTGGVGDKTTLVVAPIAAALGAVVAKMSGRGLGHTGGTIDKLEAIDGYRTSLSEPEFLKIAGETGICVTGATTTLAPADKKLYALRNLTGTVDNIPLIASSVMSKKLACGANSIVLDVKYGSGAFMKTRSEAQHLADLMVSIGQHWGRNTAAVLSDMDVPLGETVGNALEVLEAVAVLRGEGSAALCDISLSLAAHMAALALGLQQDEALRRAKLALSSGQAYEVFLRWIRAQGGNAPWLEHPEKYPQLEKCLVLKASHDGRISKMDTQRIGTAAVLLGAGREKKGDVIDPLAGIRIFKKTGDTVFQGDELAILYAAGDAVLLPAEKMYRSALEFDGSGAGNQ